MSKTYFTLNFIVYKNCFYHVTEKRVRHGELRLRLHPPPAPVHPCEQPGAERHQPERVPRVFLRQREVCRQIFAAARGRRRAEEKFDVFLQLAAHRLDQNHRPVKVRCDVIKELKLQAGQKLMDTDAEKLTLSLRDFAPFSSENEIKIQYFEVSNRVLHHLNFLPSCFKLLLSRADNLFIFLSFNYFALPSKLAA